MIYVIIFVIFFLCTELFRALTSDKEVDRLAEAKADRIIDQIMRQK